MPIAVMILQLMPKQNKQTTLVKGKIKSLNSIHVSESFTTISDDARVWFDLVESLQVLAKISLALEGHFAAIHGAVQVDNVGFAVSNLAGFPIILIVGIRTGLRSFGN